MVDDVKSILIHDLQYSKFPLIIDESSFENQSVLLPFENQSVLLPFENQSVLLPFENQSVLLPFENQSVLLPFERYMKDSRICEELLFMKTLINTTGEQVCNAVTESLKTNEISMDNMISICTDGVPSMIGRRQGHVSRLIGDRSVVTIHCALHR